MNNHKVIITNAWRAVHPPDSTEAQEMLLAVDVESFELLRSQLVDAGAVRLDGPGGLVHVGDLCDRCPHWVGPKDVSGTLEALRSRPDAVTAVDQSELQNVLETAVLHGGALVGPIL